ncbi:hypothetical protein OC834_005744 [Tilletia horrida]|nr:hypothetical protein OC834_005744 [Tilletia horrida]
MARSYAKAAKSSSASLSTASTSSSTLLTGLGAARTPLTSKQLNIAGRLDVAPSSRSKAAAFLGTQDADEGEEEDDFDDADHDVNDEIEAELQQLDGFDLNNSLADDDLSSDSSETDGEDSAIDYTTPKDGHINPLLLQLDLLANHSTQAAQANRRRTLKTSSASQPVLGSSSASSSSSEPILKNKAAQSLTGASSSGQSATSASHLALIKMQERYAALLQRMGVQTRERKNWKAERKALKENLRQLHITTHRLTGLVGILTARLDDLQKDGAATTSSAAEATYAAAVNPPPVISAQTIEEFRAATGIDLSDEVLFSEQAGREWYAEFQKTNKTSGQDGAGADAEAGMDPAALPPSAAIPLMLCLRGKDGKPVGKMRVKQIQRVVREVCAIFATLKDVRKAGPNGTIPTRGIQYHRDHYHDVLTRIIEKLESLVEELRYCEGHWKALNCITRRLKSMSEKDPRRDDMREDSLKTPQEPAPGTKAVKRKGSAHTSIDQAKKRKTAKAKAVEMASLDALEEEYGEPEDADGVPQDEEEAEADGLDDSRYEDGGKAGEVGYAEDALDFAARAAPDPRAADLEDHHGHHAQGIAQPALPGATGPQCRNIVELISMVTRASRCQPSSSIIMKISAIFRAAVPLKLNGHYKAINISIRRLLRHMSTATDNPWVTAPVTLSRPAQLGVRASTGESTAYSIPDNIQMQSKPQFRK